MNAKEAQELKKGDWVEIDKDFGKVRTIKPSGFIYLTTAINKLSRYFRPHEIKRKITEHQVKVVKTLYLFGIGKKDGDPKDT